MSAKIAICISGEPRKYKDTYESFKEYYKEHDVDVFIHTWDSTSLPGNNGEKPVQGTITHYSADTLVDDIKSKYNPVMMKVESKQTLKDVVKHLRIPWVYMDGIINTNSLSVSQWYSIQQCFALKRQYEEENNFKYDIAIRTRFDILHPREINILKEHLTFLEQDNLKNKDSTQTGECIITPWMYTTYKGHIWMEYAYLIGTSNSFDKVFNSKMINEITESEIQNPHMKICEHIMNKKVPIRSMNIKYKILR